MKIVYTSTFTDASIQIPIEAGNKYFLIIYTVAGQCLFPCKTFNTGIQSKRVPMQNTK